MTMALNPEFAQNPDPRCACVLLLDTSYSMVGPPIDALNEGLRAFQVDLQEDGLAKRRVEIAIVTFGNGGVHRVQDFTAAGSFVAPTLQADGDTPMGAAIQMGLDMVRDRKDTYDANGILRYRPWIFMITDGGPTDGDAWKSAAKRVQSEMAEKAVEFFAVGVAGADLQVLSAITPRALTLDGLKFRELFVWLSRSQRRVSASKIGDQQIPMEKVTFGSPIS